MDGVEWLVLEDESTGLAMYRTGQIDLGPMALVGRAPAGPGGAQEEPSAPGLPGFPVHVTPGAIYMRTDQPPFNDVRVRRAISHAIDRQGIIEAVWVRGEPTPAVARGLAEWSLPIDQLGAGAKYYQYDPKEARRLLAEAGFPKGFKTQLTVSSGFGRDLVDAAQLVQRYLKDVGIEAELKIQEYGAYMATTFAGQVRGPGAWAPSALPGNRIAALYRAVCRRLTRATAGHVNDPTLTAMLKEQRRTKDLEARKKLIFDIQRYAAEQQYYVYTERASMITGSWQPYVKNYGPNIDL